MSFLSSPFLPFFFFVCLVPSPSSGIFLNLAKSLDQKLADASCDGRIEDVHKYLKQGASPNAEVQNVRGITYSALGCAAFLNVEIVEALLKAGADPNVKFDGVPIIFRTWGTEITRLLIDYGAEINTLSDYGESCLYLAIANGDHSKALLLLEGGADPNLARSRDSAPLCIAVKRGEWQLAAKLVGQGASVKFAFPEVFLYGAVFTILLLAVFWRRPSKKTAVKVETRSAAVGETALVV